MKDLKNAENMSSLFDLKKAGLVGGFKNPYINKKPQFHIELDNKSKFRWQITMSSDIVAASSQGYASRSLCLENAKSLMNHLIELSKEGKLK